MQLKQNTTNQQFEIAVEEDLAYLVYRIKDQDIYLMHTKVPETLQGKGIATRLIKAALTFAEEHQYAVVLYCPFSKGFLSKHPEYEHLLKVH